MFLKSYNQENQEDVKTNIKCIRRIFDTFLNTRNLPIIAINHQFLAKYSMYTAILQTPKILNSFYFA